MDEILEQFEALSSVDRVNCICRMVDRMTYSQVRRLQQALDGHWSNARVSSRQLDALGYLPNELATLVLLQLDWYDIIQCSKVSKRWRALATANSLWKILCRRHLTMDSLATAYYWYCRQQHQYHQQLAITSPVFQTFEYSTHCLNEALATFRAWDHRPAILPDTPSNERALDWMMLFAWTVRREYNWRQCRSAVHTVIRSMHIGRVQQIKLLSNELMLTGSFDRSLIVWRLTPDADATPWARWKCNSIVALDALLLDVSSTTSDCIDSTHKTLLVIVTGHFDRQCTLWHIAIKPDNRSLYIQNTFPLQGHMAPIKAIRMSKQYAATYGDTAELYLWNWKNGHSLYRFNVEQWMVDDILLAPAPSDEILLACQTGAIVALNTSDHTSSDTQQLPIVRILQQPTMESTRQSVRLHWLVSGEVTEDERPALKFARITEQNTELFLLHTRSQCSTTSTSANMGVTLLGRVATTVNIHHPISVIERRIITMIPYGAILQSLSNIETTSNKHPLDCLFDDIDKRKEAQDTSSELDAIDSGSLWKFILIKQSDLEGKRVTSLAIDANRLVVGCIDGTVFIYQFVSQASFTSTYRILYS
ncbi:hypothetical protein BDF22DRAFT_671510 [Syncephalis plumigaleata]|nr:hypothetical protein BDF22DRAFT_671510 [Syncephalis plumigaleata]